MSVYKNTSSFSIALRDKISESTYYSDPISAKSLYPDIRRELLDNRTRVIGSNQKLRVKFVQLLTSARLSIICDACQGESDSFLIKVHMLTKEYRRKKD